MKQDMASRRRGGRVAPAFAARGQGSDVTDSRLTLCSQFFHSRRFRTANPQTRKLGGPIQRIFLHRPGTFWAFRKIFHFFALSSTLLGSVHPESRLNVEKKNSKKKFFSKFRIVVCLYYAVYKVVFFTKIVLICVKSL